MFRVFNGIKSLRNIDYLRAAELYKPKIETVVFHYYYLISDLNEKDNIYDVN